MSALAPKADIQGLAQYYIIRVWPDVRFRGQNGRKSKNLKTSLIAKSGRLASIP
jgi:hypothetical protein